MYKILLCLRYLRTRYIALASIISVMLGVATMIVVNSVMSGFTTEMKNRIHGILSDLVFESRSLEGFADADERMDQIRRVAGESIEGMTPTVVVPAMVGIRIGESTISQPVQLIGIDEQTHSQVSVFGDFLQHPENRSKMSFELREGGYDVHDHQAGPDVAPRRQMADAGWQYRRMMARFRAAQPATATEETSAEPGAAGALAEANSQVGHQPVPIPQDPFLGARPEQQETFDPTTRQHAGAVLGIAMASFRQEVEENQFEERFIVLPGDDITVSFPTAGMPPEIVSRWFTVVDFYESKMSEYDASFLFVPIRKLQEYRGMRDPTSGLGLVNSIQIKLKPGADPEVVRDKIRAAFSPQLYTVSTWRDKQGPLLAAVQMETAILNVLLFLIITVAGFGILAIFLMIVVEKTRDIGVLKALGASGGGVMGIFLSYGLSLGLVGSGVGLIIGLVFVRYINEIAAGLGWITGRPVFDPEIYYFYKIPAIVDPATIAWILLGAISIAVLASVLPALCAVRDCIRWRLCDMSSFSSTTRPPQPKTKAQGGPHFPLEQTQPGPSCALKESTNPRTELLRTENLEKSYHKGSIEIQVLRGVQLQVNQGEFLAIVGQSGSGKSTLLHLLGTLDAPDAGTIHFHDRRIDNLPTADRDRLRNRYFGMIFQFYHLLPELSTLENVLTPLMIGKSALGFLRDRRALRTRAEMILEMVGLGHRFKHKPRELSGGEMQRAAIARALVTGPELLLADEPTGNLDHATGEGIVQILSSLNRQEKLTIVMVTHDVTVAQRADRVVRLVDGRVEDA